MSDIVRTVLWASIESYVGLWELHWEINTLRPDSNSDENRKTAEKVVNALLHAELAHLYWCTWGDAETVTIDSERVSELLKQPTYWHPPSGGDVCICLASNEKGEECYRDEVLLRSFAEENSLVL